MTSLNVSEAKSGDLPERRQQHSNAREKVFRPHREFPFKKQSRRQPVVIARQMR
jgi:hypothetical protein